MIENYLNKTFLFKGVPSHLYYGVKSKAYYLKSAKVHNVTVTPTGISIEDDGTMVPIIYKSLSALINEYEGFQLID